MLHQLVTPLQTNHNKQQQYEFLFVSHFPFCVLHCSFIYGLIFNSCSSSRSNKTFKPKKNIPEGTHQYDLMKHAAATLGSGNLRLAVKLPEGEDGNEWVAVNSKYCNL